MSWGQFRFCNSIPIPIKAIPLQFRIRYPTEQTEYMVQSQQAVVVFGKANANNCRVTIEDVEIEHVDAKLSWFEHTYMVRKKVSKKINVMYRIRWILDQFALFSLYCSLVLPYLNYCCEVWGSTYRKRIQLLYLLRKRAIRICAWWGYRAHIKSTFLKFRTLNIMDLVDFKSMIVMYRVAHEYMPIDIMYRFRTVRTTHQHNTHQENNFTHRLVSKCKRTCFME